MVREYTIFAYVITTFCNKSCPNCCYRIPQKKHRRHVPWEEIERTAPYFTGMRLLHISGGEPLLHPHFDRIAPLFGDVFEPLCIAVTTNGIVTMKHAAALRNFDCVNVTMFPGNEGLPAALEERGIVVHPFPGEHLAMDVPGPGRGKPCHRKDVGLYFDGRLWPCCVAPGVAGAQSMELREDWRTSLRSIPTPCAACPFSGTEWLSPESECPSTP